MKRREFVAGLAGATAWTLVARGQQQTERIRRIGVLMSTSPGDAEGQARLAAFLQSLQSLGWAENRNLRIEIRWAAGNLADTRKYAAELLAHSVEVFLASGGSVVGPLLEATRTVPVVFTQTPDPVGAGFVASLARPGGNATGFTQVEYGIGAQWLGLLKELAPHVVRAAVLRDPAIPEGSGQFGAMQSVAPSFGVELRPIGVRDAGEIERDLMEFARSPNAGVIVTSSGLGNVHRELITGLAARHRLPAVYPIRSFVSGGGLMSYGADSIEPHRRAASYVNRILKGEAPAEMPVQAPTKYDLVINLKAAKALGLGVPTALLARADEVIE
jgi:putative ABC transport system substrate-binding protein